jgi:hypothetical protein
MAKGPGPALLLAAVAALFLLKGKKGNGGTVAPESDDPGSPGGEKEKPATGTPATPKAKTQEELEEEYDPEAEAQADTTNEKIIAEAQWKKWPAGSELSQLVANHNVILDGIGVLLLSSRRSCMTQPRTGGLLPKGCGRTKWSRTLGGHMSDGSPIDYLRTGTQSSSVRWKFLGGRITSREWNSTTRGRLI